MASMEKYCESEIGYELRHNTRESPRPPANQEIDSSRTHLNYSLAPADRGGAQPLSGQAAKTARDYYNYRKQQVYCYGRKDLVTACQWVVTLPEDVKPAEEEFFETVNAFLNQLYGVENCIQAIVHKDEGVKGENGTVIVGRPHLHYVFLPVVKNQSYMKENRYGNISGSALFEQKLCANELINKNHLLQFHSELQKAVEKAGLKATAHSGVTRNNRTVNELKLETMRVQLRLAQERIHDLEREIKLSREKNAELSAEKEALKNRLEELKHETSLMNRDSNQVAIEWSQDLNPEIDCNMSWDDYEWNNRKDETYDYD